MKKKLKMTFAVSLLVPTMAVPSFGATLGDVNNDGQITADDSSAALQICLTGIVPENCLFEMTDVNGDGIVDSRDSAHILQKALDNNYEFNNGETSNIITVNGSLSQDDPANNTYATIEAAYEAAPAGTAENPTVISIMPGVYRLHGDESKNGLSITKDYLTFVGLSDDPNDVVIADNRGNNQGASGNYNSATVVSNCTGLTLKNISIYNYCNVDVPYAKDPSQALTKRSDLETQAFAYFGGGDKHFYDNCQFISILDTFENDVKRGYYKNCYIQGTNDFIMGWGGIQVLDGCTINSLSNHVVGGGEKFLFKDCTFQLNKPEGTLPTYLCKGWANITLLNCQIPTDKGTYQWTPSLPGQYTFQYRNLTDSTGAKANIVDDSCAIELTDEQADAYNLWNVLRGDDDWDPANCRTQYENKGSEPMRVVTNDAITVKTGEASGTITASVYPARANQNVTFTAEGDVTIEQNGNKCTVTANNHTLNPTTAIVTATASNGIKNKTVVTVEPKIEDAPTFTKEPTVNISNGAINVDYALDLGVASNDTSLITWYRCDDAEGNGAIAIADSKMDTPTKSYTLCEGDIGKYIKMVIAPDSELSKVGDAVTVMYPNPITADDVTSANIDTNFQSVPTHPPFITTDVLNSVLEDGVTPYRTLLEKSIPGTVKGKWNFIGDWYYNYGSGTYASNVKGAITGTRYCRAIYAQPTNDYGDMSAVVDLTPEKTAGQGFGSAGQYEELLIKFDPDTQTGCGIHYMRSKSMTNTIEFQLMEYKDGVGTPIGDMQYIQAGFRDRCRITLDLTGTTLTANVSSQYVDALTGEGVTPITLTGTITNVTNFGGFEIYHQGSTGGRYVFENVSLNYGARTK